VAKQVLTPPAAASRPGTEPSPSDQLVREILEAVDAVSLERVADDLRALGDGDARAASGSVTATIRLPASS
jgi:hypothetical protein